MKGKNRIGGVVLVLALLLVGAFGLNAYAGTDSSNERNGEQVAVQMEQEYQNFLTKLADNLGVTEDVLEAALVETQKQILDEKVADGTLTQDEAAKIAEHGVRIGIGGHGPGAGGPPHGQPGEQPLDKPAASDSNS